MKVTPQELREAAKSAPLWQHFLLAAANEIERLQALSVKGSAVKTNSPDILPPVGSLLLIDVGGSMVQARRTGYIASRGDAMEYKIETSGDLISGRFRWCYV